MVQRVTGSLQFANFATAEISPVRVKDWAAAFKLFTILDNAVLTGRGFVHVIEAFDPGTSLTADIGDGVDPDEFTFDGVVDLETPGITALSTGAGVFPAQEYGVTGEVEATFVLTGAEPTVGKAVVYMEYLRPDAADGVS